VPKLTLANSRAARTAPAGTAAPAVTRRDTRFATLLGIMMWVQLIYMTVVFDWDNVESRGANPLLRSVKVALLVLGAAIILSRTPVRQGVFKELNRYLIAFVALAGLSTLWSIDRGATLARVVSLLSIMFVCLAFGIGAWHPKRLQNVLRPILTLILLASLIAGIISPDLVMEKGETYSLKGAWHGLTTQKNVFGTMASFGVVFWVHAWLAGEAKLWWVLIGVGVSGACLVLSHSSTSLLATAFVIAFLLMLMRSPPSLRRYMPYIVGAFAIITVAYGLAVLRIVPMLDHLLDPITALTGKDKTFSARTQIWDIIKEHIQDSPILGTGYGAYWTAPVPSSPSYIFLSRMQGFWPGEAHNGYLEMVNDLGYVGLICLSGFLIVYIRQCIKLLKLDRYQAALLLGLFFQQIIENLSGTNWLSVISFAFVIMTSATISLARALYEHRRGNYTVSRR
jgi:O-antigen ligase